MEFDSVVNRRKSIRKYSAKDVPQEYIETIIAFGNKAPTACGLNALSIIEVREESDKIGVVKTTYKGNLYKDSKVQSWMIGSPVFLIVCVDMDKCRQKYGKDNYKKDAYLNASANIQNMLLKAVDLGLGGCYVTGFREKELAEFLGTNSCKEIIAIVTLGYEG